MKIISTKLNPKDIYPILEIFKKNDSVDIIKEKIHEYLSIVSPTGKISKRNAIYALALPTLKRLGLLNGSGKNIHLTSDAELLLKKYEEEGTLSYKKQLAKVIYNTDKNNAGILDLLYNNNINEISKENLIELLKNNKIETKINDDRLNKWLRILNYVDFIEYNNYLKINRFQINSILSDKVVDDDIFINTLLKSYKELVREKRGNPYIPIPKLQSKVCNELLDKGLSTYDFRKKLVNLLQKENSKYNILLSKPGAREPNGLRINGEYYYYLSIYEVNEN